MGSGICSAVYDGLPSPSVFALSGGNCRARKYRTERRASSGSKAGYVSRILGCDQALVLGCCAAILLLNSWQMRPAAAQTWPDQREAGRFLLFADFPLDQHHQLVSHMACLQKDLHEAIGLDSSQAVVHLFLFQNKRSYQDYLRQYFPSVPFRRALFIKGRGPGMVFAYQQPEFEVDVRHEGTHALLHSQLPTVPLWLDEGFAEYFEVPADQRAFDHPHLTRAKWAARFRYFRPLEDLERLRGIGEMGNSEYRAAWAWVHFLLHGSPAARDELIRYVHDMQRHDAPGRLSSRLERRIPDLNDQFLAHFRSWQKS